MSYEALLTLQGYAKFFILLIVCIIFYSYAYSIYKRQNNGERDFEKYSRLVLDDSIDSEPLEKIRKTEKIEKES